MQQRQEERLLLHEQMINTNPRRQKAVQESINETFLLPNSWWQSMGSEIALSKTKPTK